MTEQKKYTNRQIIIFVVVICFVCALILSILASALKNPQKRARELYQSKQLLISSRILSYGGYFVVEESEDKFVPAAYNDSENLLIPTKITPPPKAKDADILRIYETRVQPRLVDEEGNLYTFSQLNIDFNEYIKEHMKSGYAHLPYKLLYIILPNKQEGSLTTPYGYVIPINGYGLWGPIYGYLTLASDANHIIGTTWYDQEETPGLGGNIGLPSWQKQFFDKQIFQPSMEGQTNFQKATLGIIIVKTAVKDELKGSPKAVSAVDGIPGASITVKGVTEAYRSSLNPYRAFLIKAHQQYQGETR